MIKAMIFDMDGTIGNTIPLCIKAFRRTIESFLERVVDDEEIIATFGPSEEGTIKALIPEHYEEGVDQYLYNYRVLHKDCPEPFEGIIEVIREIKEKGILVAMVTGKGRKSADITLEQFGIEDLFQCIETGSINGNRKCEGITSVIDYFNIKPQEAFYIGDSPSDILSARQAGVGIISVAWADMIDLEQIRILKPDRLFKTIKEFKEFCNSISCFELENHSPWLDWAMELQSIAQAGLTYSKDNFDIERFKRIREISAEILKQKSGLSMDIVKDLFCNETGYQTPKMDCRAAILRDDKILLVKEQGEGAWALPGGWIDVNQSVKSNIEKEVREEAGLEVVAQRIIAIQDRNKHNVPRLPYGICKVFVVCDILGGEFVPNIEISECGYFAIDNLPILSLTRNNEEQIRMCFQAYYDENWKVQFD